MVPAGFVEGKDIKGPLVHILQDQEGRKNTSAHSGEHGYGLDPEDLACSSHPGFPAQDSNALSTPKLFPTRQTYIAFTDQMLNNLIANNNRYNLLSAYHMLGIVISDKYHNLS